MFDPHDHTCPCPEHGIRACLTCHEVDGECSAGGCTRTAARTFERVDARGRVIERRAFCATCSTHPAFGWLRAGMRPAA